MSPWPARRSRKLVLSRETIRNLQDQAMVMFGPQTSETEACCGETIDKNGRPITF